jgi:hypothetical protein
MILLFFAIVSASVLLFLFYVLQIAPLLSPLRHLPGPPSTNLIYGHWDHVRMAEVVQVHEKWLEQFGKTMKFKSLFNVGTFVSRICLPLAIDCST